MPEYPNRLTDAVKSDLEKVRAYMGESVNEYMVDEYKKYVSELIYPGGKMIRPCMHFLCVKACEGKVGEKDVEVASAIELIHTASLLHDDIVDESSLRRNSETANSIWGEYAALVIGDYMFALACEIINGIGSDKVVNCLTDAVKNLALGQIMQVSERDNIELKEKHYLEIITRKTAYLFAASCKSAALAHQPSSAESMWGFGLNYGIAYQMVDDYMDVTGRDEDLGKSTRQSVKSKEVTLPLIYLMEEDDEVEAMLKEGATEEVGERMLGGGVPERMKAIVKEYSKAACDHLDCLEPSEGKKSLIRLAKGVDGRI